MPRSRLQIAGVNHSLTAKINCEGCFKKDDQQSIRAGTELTSQFVSSNSKLTSQEVEKLHPSSVSIRTLEYSGSVSPFVHSLKAVQRFER